MPDALRLALGTLTAFRVPAPRQLSRGIVRAAMLLAPLVGLVLGLLAALVLTAVRFVGGPQEAVARTAAGAPAVTAADLLAAVLAVVTLALATRALHLDGVADTADAFGSRRPAAEALAIAKRSDIGPFGVVTLVLVLLVDVAALTLAATAHHGTSVLVVAVVAGRVGLLWACRTGVPAARPGGLGALVAGSVPTWAALAWTAVAAAGAWLAARLDDDTTASLQLTLPLAVVAASGAAFWLVSRATYRLGGVTGDVMGATVELATTTALVVAALA